MMDIHEQTQLRETLQEGYQAEKRPHGSDPTTGVRNKREGEKPQWGENNTEDSRD